jgi:hypothetical protein
MFLSCSLVFLVAFNIQRAYHGGRGVIAASRSRSANNSEQHATDSERRQRHNHRGHNKGADMSGTITGYKGFDKEMKCRGFQFEVGQTYTHEGTVQACSSGFHSCENPFDVWSYYGPSNSVYCEIEASGEISRHDSDSKIASASITIKATLSLPQFIGRAVDWIIAACAVAPLDSGNAAQIGSSGNAAQIGSSGDAAQIGSSGYRAQIGSSGDAAQIGSSGNAAQIGSSGDAAQIGSSGDAAQIGSSGNAAKIGSSGNAAKIGSSGYRAQIGSSGYRAQIGSSGDAAQIGSSGDAAKIGSSGYRAQIGSSGYRAQIGSSGDAAKIGSSGYAAKIGSSGNAAQIEASGAGSVVAAIGDDSAASAGPGGWIVLAAYDAKGKVVCVKAAKVGGPEGVEANVLYRLTQTGNFLKVKE